MCFCVSKVKVVLQDMIKRRKGEKLSDVTQMSMNLLDYSRSLSLQNIGYSKKNIFIFCTILFLFFCEILDQLYGVFLWLKLFFLLSINLLILFYKMLQNTENILTPKTKLELKLFWAVLLDKCSGSQLIFLEVPPLVSKKS